MPQAFAAFPSPRAVAHPRVSAHRTGPVRRRYCAALSTAPPTSRPPARRPRRRLRRFALGLLIATALAHDALPIVRLLRGYRPVESRAYLAGGPLVIAHRGASAVVAEHTLASYRRAIGDGADVLELDLRLTADGLVALSHDRDLRRAHGVDLVIAQHDLAALRRAIADRHPELDPSERLPTLAEVMDAFPAARLNLELKDDSVALADAVAALIDRRGAHDRVLVASFRQDALDRFRRVSGGRVATSASPREAIGFYVCYLFEVPCRPAYHALQIPTRLRRGSPSIRFDGREFIAFAHRHGLAVHYWTVNDEDEMRRLIARGADGIITDVPARARAAVEAAR